jgi:hypothetical protein
VLLFRRGFNSSEINRFSCVFHAPKNKCKTLYYICLHFCTGESWIGWFFTNVLNMDK